MIVYVVINEYFEAPKRVVGVYTNKKRAEDVAKAEDEFYEEKCSHVFEEILHRGTEVIR